MAKFKYGNVVHKTATSALNSDISIAVSDPQIQFFTPNVDGRSVTLPNVALADGIKFVIVNLSEDYDLVVKNDSGETLSTIKAEQTGGFVSNGVVYNSFSTIESLDDLTDVQLTTLGANKVLAYGYDGYGYWTNVDAIDYFEALGFARDHTDLTGMPDTYGYNEDHDARYVAKVQDDEPTIPTPFQGMFWYDTDDDDGFAFNIGTVTGNYLLQALDDVILVNGGISNVTILIPPAANIPGKVYNIKNIGTGQVTIDPDGTETIDGGLIAILTAQYECITIISNGSNWWII